ncbi:MAG: hypothetical protein HY917_02190 [Candidatus Diapherotrites archaeon]|nr:hypothetical protein [Candidatus Diapherotrites archaeon]
MASSGHGDRQPVYGGNGESEYQQYRLRRTALTKEQKEEIMRRSGLRKK